MGSPTGADDIADARSVELPARPPAGDTTHEDGAETTGRSPPAPSPYGVAPIAVIIIFSCLATVSYRNTSRASLYRALEWMSQNLILGRAIFLVVYVLCMALMLPGSVLAVLAGALFGMPWGCALVYLGNLMGQTVAFLLARFLMRDYIRSYIEARWRRFSLIDAAMQQEGWRLVCILRLSPCVPYNLLNFALGVTGIPFAEYSWSSALAIIPYVVIFTYFGCVSKNVLAILEGDWNLGESVWTWAAAATVAVLLMVVYLVLFTKRALDRALVEAVTPSKCLAQELSPPRHAAQSMFGGENLNPRGHAGTDNV